MKPISRLGVGSLFIIQLVLALLIFISAAYLSANYFKVWDFSKDEDYTLSDLTEKILAKKPLSERPDPVQIIVAFRKNSPYFQRVRRTTFGTETAFRFPLASPSERRRRALIARFFP